MVTDTGPGLSPGNLGRIFEPSDQGNRPAPSSEAGTGLGLPFARRFARLTGGDLSADHRPSARDPFTFSLPLELIPSAEPTAKTAAPTPRGYTDPRRRVLAVDDVATNRDLIVALLAPLGFEVRVAADGSSALAVVQTFHPTWCCFTCACRACRASRWRHNCAPCLGTGVRTIHKYGENIIRKLGGETRAAAAVSAQEHLRAGG